MFFRKRKSAKRQPQKESQVRHDAKANLAKEIRKNYISISNSITRIYYETNWMEDGSINFLSKHYDRTKELSNRSLDILFEIYDLCGNMSNYKELHDIVFERSFVEMVAKNNFHNEDVIKIMMNYDNSVKQIKGTKDEISGNSYFEKAKRCGFIEIYKNFINRDLDYFACGFIFNLYKGNDDNFNEHWTDFRKSQFIYISNHYNDELLLYVMQYGYDFLFMCYIILLRKYNVFIQNKDLMLVMEQIRKNNEIKQDIFKEFYLIYSSLYKSAYKEEFTYNEIRSFIIQWENCEKEKLFRACNYYSKEIELFKKHKDFEKLIDSIDKHVFLKEHVCKDCYIELDEHYLCNDLFDYLMIKIMDYLSDDEFLKILSAKEVYVNRLLELKSK